MKPAVALQNESAISRKFVVKRIRMASSIQANPLATKIKAMKAAAVAVDNPTKEKNTKRRIRGQRGLKARSEKSLLDWRLERIFSRPKCGMSFMFKPRRLLKILC